MFEAVIFDYGRTIYDPEAKQLFPHTKQVLEELASRKLKLALVSIADTTKQDRLNDLIRFEVEHFFGEEETPKATIEAIQELVPLIDRLNT